MIKTFDTFKVRSVTVEDPTFARIAIGASTHLAAPAQLTLSESAYYRLDEDTGELRLRTDLPPSVSPWQGGPPPITPTSKTPAECSLQLRSGDSVLRGIDVRGATNTRLEVSGLVVGRMSVFRNLSEEEQERARSRFVVCEVKDTMLQGDSFIHTVGGGVLRMSNVTIMDGARLFVATHGGDIDFDRKVEGDYVVAQVAGECNSMCAYALSQGESLAMPVPPTADMMPDQF